MKAVSAHTEQVIKGNNRRYAASLVFSFLSCKVPESIKIHAPHAQNGSVTDQIVYPYLSHIQNRLFTQSPLTSRLFPAAENSHTDGRLHRVRFRPYSRIGYIGKKADAQGSVHDTVTLYLPPTTLKRVTLITAQDRIIHTAVITAKTRFGNVLQTVTIEHNTKTLLILDIPCEKAGILELHISRHSPNKRIWLLAFYPGFEFLVSEKDIVKIKHLKRKTENKEGSIGRLYINSITLELNNSTRIYDDKNRNSPIAGHFNANTLCSIQLRLLQHEGVKPFYLTFGSFFVMQINTDEAKATVTIMAQDYIGIHKNTYLALGIQDETDAYTCFAKIAHALSLAATRIDEQLRHIKLKRVPLNGTVGTLLNTLCIATNAFCSCNESGTALIASLLLSRHGTIRYPSRYFLLNEYKQNASSEQAQNTPNVINLAYTTYEYEGELHIKSKEVIPYSRITKQPFPDQFKHALYGDYPIGGGKTPSWTYTYLLPQHFVTVAFSDDFIPKALEYTVDYTYDTLGTAIKALVRVWNFIERHEGEQLSIALMVKEKPVETLLKKETFEIAQMPKTYRIPDSSVPIDASDRAAVEKRNELNTGETFHIVVKDAVSISRVEIANRFIPSKFEFVFRKTVEGIVVTVWNYFPEHPQTLTVNLYGNRLVPGKEKKIITARNEDDIQERGEVIKTIEVGALASDAVAKRVLASMAYYYRRFSHSISVQTWADPRLMLYDLVAFKSLRGYGFVQGIIDEIELEYTGALTQKLTIRQTKKHTRDSRVCSGILLNDRPFLPNAYTGYA